MIIKEAIAQVVEGHDLSESESEDIMTEIMDGEARPAQIAAYITALRMKGETVEEITGAARVMRSKVLRIAMQGDLVDTCGTGGDGSGTFNISTVSAFVIAGAGVKVAKHGNRSVSSKCGSADLLTELGVNVDMDPGLVMDCIREANFGFMFAPNYHQSMKHAVGPRRDIGIRTIFNCLGPVTNPANAAIQVLGVYSKELADKIAKVLVKLGTKNSFVIHGMDGLDEITLTTDTHVCEIKNGSISEYILKPTDLGLSYCRTDEIKGAGPKENGKIALAVLNGESGAKTDIVILNAAPALLASGRASNMKEGMDIARESIKSGKALDALEKLKEVSNRV